MPDDFQQNSKPQSAGARLPTWSERIFLSDGGQLRPIVRGLLFGVGALLLEILVGGFVFTYTQHATVWWQLFWVSIATVPPLLLLSVIFVRFLDRQKFSSMGLSFAQGWFRQLALGAGLGLALQLLILAIFAATHSVHYSAGTAYNLHFWKNVALNVGLFFIAATVEELLFRGYAFQRFIEAFGVGGAVALTSVIFGLAHGGNPGAQVLSIFNTVLAGVLLALAYVRTRSMWMQIGLHCSWNFFMVTVVSLPVSGLSIGPTLFVAQNTGPAWLTGGSYGPEGGIGVTVISLVGIAWLILTRRLSPSHSLPEDLQ